MNCEQRIDRVDAEQGVVQKLRVDHSIVAELIKVLAPQRGGLRRWSVMRAIRANRERDLREIPQKLEDEVERTFRRYCADFGDAKLRTCTTETALFHRPREKAGEVWAVHIDRANAWLESEHSRFGGPGSRLGDLE
jgi:hypothetical protein